MNESPNPALAQFLEFFAHTPHQRALGFEVLAADAVHAAGRIPYGPELVGNPVAGIVHGGVVTTLLDTVGGIAVFSRLAEPVTIATLDLRIDYLRPATPRIDIFAAAEAYKVTRQVVFTRATAYQNSPDDLVAASVGTFMLSGRLGVRVSGEGKGGEAAS